MLNRSKERYLLDGIHCVGCKQGRGRIEGLRAVGMGTWRKAKFVPPAMEGV